MFKSGCFALVVLLIPFCSFAQEENALPWVAKEPAYDTAPIFPGGADALNRYLSDSLRYPVTERMKGIQGHVLLKFEVTRKGTIINVVPVNGVPGGPNLMKEAIRLVEAMPRWKPATLRGKKVQAEYWLSIPFRLPAGR